MTRTEIGERIREIRKAKNFTREQLATKSELSSKFIYEVENGKKGLSVDSLMKIAKALSCSCDYILMEESTGELRYESVTHMLAGLDDKDVAYVTKMISMIKDMREKTEE